MAAHLQKIVSNMLRHGHIHKFGLQKQYIPIATFCEETLGTQKRHKFDVNSLISEEGYEATEEPVLEQTPESFASMFRKSKFVQLGDIKDRILAGRIFYVLNDDLYINFGGKFYCVCPKPSFKAEEYVKGQRVRVMVHKFEMTSSFLGSEQHITLLEADATLLGLFDQLPHLKEGEIKAKGSPVSGGFAEKMLAKKASEDDASTVQDSPVSGEFAETLSSSQASEGDISVSHSVNDLAQTEQVLEDVVEKITIGSDTEPVKTDATKAENSEGTVKE